MLEAAIQSAAFARDEADAASSLHQIANRNAANAIAAFRKAHGMTQADLAHQLGTSMQFVSLLEKGERTVSAGVAAKLVRIAKRYRDGR